MSPRPGRIVAEFEVPFDHPRSFDVRLEPEFGILTNRVSLALREAS
jgi:NitT/TauT family transport system ATP-binding protein